jgi:hypothetical protein
VTYFTSAKARLFGEIGACVLNSGGRLSSAQDHADVSGANAEVRRLLRSVGLLSEIEAAPFYQSEARAFLETMVGHSAFDSITPLAQRVPMRRRIAALSAIIAGDGPEEGAAKMAAPFDIDGDQLALLKAIALVVQSAELASALTTAGVDFLLDQVRAALGPATDLSFFRAILTGVSAEAATGTDAESFRADVAAALLRLGLGQNSRPVIVVDPTQAISLAFVENGGGGQAFVDMSFMGGTVSGVPVFVSSGIPANDDVSPAGRQIVVLDAQGVALDPGEITLAPSAEANVTIDGQTLNMWHSNLNALMAERWFGAAVTRQGAVQLIAGQYGPSETSP